MAIIVQKYGGSSVADMEKLRHVARKIAARARQGYQLVVVVSAMGDTTDDLLARAHQLTDNPSRRELDMLLSVGERISMALLSMAIHQEGLEAISLTGSQCGIITTASHANARIMDVRPFRVQDELDRGHIVIVAGYQGTSYKREVTTLGRGGSDTTAVALAAALGAEACEIYSDVDGVYSADPRVVLDAHKIEALSHEEMLEMARSGAKVLNEQAVEFARRARIALYARSTHKPDSRGTIVRPDGFDEDAARAESGLPAVAVSHITRGLWVIAQESADAAIALLAERATLVCEWTPGAHLRAFLATDDMHDRGPLLQQLLALGEDVSCQEQGLVSLIGQGVGSRPTWAIQAHNTLVAADLPPLATAITPVRLSWVLDPAQVLDAANVLHAMV